MQQREQPALGDEPQLPVVSPTAGARLGAGADVCPLLPEDHAAVVPCTGGGMGLNHTAGTDPGTSAEKRVEMGWGGSK